MKCVECRWVYRSVVVPIGWFSVVDGGTVRCVGEGAAARVPSINADTMFILEGPNYVCRIMSCIELLVGRVIHL